VIAFAKPPGTSVGPTADELLAEFRATGAPPAFEELVRRYAAMVFSECYAVTKSRHDAEDAAQATFLTLAVQARTGEEIRYLGPWLQRVSRRVALDQEKAKRRRKKREDNHHRINGTAGVATAHRDGLDQLELRHLINDELQALPVKYRMPLILHYFGGLSRDQMAAELKCKPATLGVRLFRAREMLGKRLKKKGIALPAAMLPLGIAMVVRESVEQHGVMAMAASASQIADAAARVAVGLRPTTGTVSLAALALAESASHELILKKVRLIVAAAAIGASALAAGGATVVERIASASLPSLIDVGGYIRSLIGPNIDLRVDTTQRLDAGQPLPDAWPRALAFAGGEGRLELTTVTNRPVSDAPRPTPTPSGSSFPPKTLAKAANGQSALLIAGGPTPAASDRNHENSTTQTPHSSADSDRRAAETGAPFRAASSASRKPASPGPASESAVLPHNDSPNFASAASSSGPWGGGGSFSSNTKFSLRPVPIASSRSPATLASSPRLSTTSSSRAGGSLTSEIGSSSPFTVASQLSADGDVLRGWGTPALSGDLDNSGVVIADGYGQPRTLDLSSVARVYNDIPNPPRGVNGWYARDGGKLTLPQLPVASGRSTVTWGDDPSAAKPDLVNAIQLTVVDAQHPGNLTVSLLASDRGEIPKLPAGYEALSVWSLSGLEPTSASTLELTARYFIPGSDVAAELGGLGVYYLAAGQWKSADSSVDPSRRLITATDIPVSEFLALLTANTGVKTSSFFGNFALESLAATSDLALERLISPLQTLSNTELSPMFAFQNAIENRPNRFDWSKVPGVSLSAGLAGGSTVVPEPAAPIFALGLGVATLLTRKRRN